MVRGAEERLREYRRLLPGGDRAGALDGRFWDAVVLTAANDRQAETYVQQLDALHARGQLPGARERYLVISDPPGPRVGSGGATLHVMLRLQALVGSGWSAKKLFLLHAGGYSERSPAHGTLGKAFGQLPFDAAGVGVPATVLETQLVSFQELPSRLPSGIFVSSADVAAHHRVAPSCPVLFLFGGNKPARFHGDAWLAAIDAKRARGDGSAWREIKDAGHWFPAERADETFEALDRWLRETRRDETKRRGGAEGGAEGGRLRSAL